VTRKLPALIRSLRPEQWLKNGFVYLYLLHRHELGGNPTKPLLTDRPLLICVVFWLSFASVVIGAGR
jgi:hypothetical protein